MSEVDDQAPFYARKGYRLVAGGFGLFLTGVGVYALFVGGVSPVLRWTAAAALVISGGNLAYSALQASESWLSKLGPLP